MMCELGNDIDCVSKFIGHASIETTKKYYVKKSFDENINKMNIPWIEKKEENKFVLPQCPCTLR